MMESAEVTRLRTLVTVALLAMGLCSCGDSGSGRSSHAGSGAAPDGAPTSAVAAETSPVPVDRRVDADRDNDIGAANDDTNNDRVMAFGRAASPSERRAVTALVKRYYATALAGAGERGCSMLYSTLAEAAVEDDAQPPGPAYMRGAKTCAAVMALLFKHYHAQLAAELPKLSVTRVRLEEHHGFAFLSFGALPEREISVVRERRTWKLNTIYDQELP